MKSSKLEYRPAAFLVIESEKTSRPKEPSGAAVSLAGRLGAARMGDRVGRERPAELEERLEKARKRRERAEAEAAAAAAASGAGAGAGGA
jgi:pre-mRNA-splicing helicase BRR2